MITKAAKPAEGVDGKREEANHRGKDGGSLTSAAEEAESRREGWQGGECRCKHKQFMGWRENCGRGCSVATSVLKIMNTLAYGQ